MQSSQRQLPLLLSDTNQASPTRDLRTISGLLNDTCRRPISCQSNSVVFQARKTTNYFDGPHQENSDSKRNSGSQRKDNNNDRNGNHDNNGKPKKGGSSLRSPGGRQHQEHHEDEHETTGQKLARKFGWQTNTSKKMTSSPSQSKKINQDGQSGPSRSSNASSTTSSRSQFGTSASNNERDMRDGHERQTNKRQTRSSSILSSSSSSSSRPNDHQQRRDHRAGGSVRHDKQGSRFILDLGNNQVARIDYRPVQGRQTNKFNLSGGGRHGHEDNQPVIELYHTEVPDELRGQGIGKQLARGALECASGANMRLKITCDYLRDYVHRFASPAEKKLIIGLDEK